jgi:hypothetical protein
MELFDKKLGEAGEVKVEQVAAVLSVEADLKNPISVSGVVIGEIEGKVIVSIQETAVIDALEKKYPNPMVVGALEVLKKGIALVS